MNIRRIVAGQMCTYEFFDGDRCAYIMEEPATKCEGAEGGIIIHGTDAIGNRMSFADDSCLRLATMQEQRDFWKEAYEEEKERRECNE